MSTMVESWNNIFSNQIKQMRAQKNHMDPRIIELLFLKSKVDFELLWRCISKIRTTSHVATYTIEIVIIKYIYSLANMITV